MDPFTVSFFCGGLLRFGLDKRRRKAGTQRSREKQNEEKLEKKKREKNNEAAKQMR